jgi:hypothetical protein
MFRFTCLTNRQLHGRFSTEIFASISNLVPENSTCHSMCFRLFSKFTIRILKEMSPYKKKRIIDIIYLNINRFQHETNTFLSAPLHE